MTNLIPPTPSPRPPTTPHESTISAMEHIKGDPAMVSHAISADPTSASTLHAHQCTLDFIMEAAQKLYAKGHLHIKPYTGYLKENRKKVHTVESET